MHRDVAAVPLDSSIFLVAVSAHAAKPVVDIKKVSVEQSTSSFLGFVVMDGRDESFSWVDDRTGSDIFPLTFLAMRWREW